MRAIGLPDEANAILIVNTNAVLASAITLEFFQTQPRMMQVAKLRREFEPLKRLSCSPFDGLKFPNRNSFSKAAGNIITVRPNHYT